MPVPLSTATTLSARLTDSDLDGIVVVLLAIALILGSLLVLNRTSRR